jgi:hypothetical protein
MAKLGEGFEIAPRPAAKTEDRIGGSPSYISEAQQCSDGRLVRARAVREIFEAQSDGRFFQVERIQVHRSRSTALALGLQ